MLNINELKRLAMPVALHEAGHYIVGRVHGFEVGELKAKVLYPDSFIGSTQIIILAQKLTTLEAIVSYLEKRIQVLYAGVLSQSLERMNVNEDKANEYHVNEDKANEYHVNEDKANDYLKTNGKDDHCKVRELLRILLNIKCSSTENDKNQKQLSEIERDLWKRTIKCVETEETHIRGLGEYFADKIEGYDKEFTVTVEDIEKMPALTERFKIK
jgi:hypothetical protein